MREKRASQAFFVGEREERREKEIVVKGHSDGAQVQPPGHLRVAKLPMAMHMSLPPMSLHDISSTPTSYVYKLLVSRHARSGYRNTMNRGKS